MLTSAGTLRYSPALLGGGQEKWWLVMDCDREIGRYYRSLYEMHWNRCRKIQPSSWAEHVTIIRNEEPPEANKKLWLKYDGLSVDFSYSPNTQSDDLYVWLSVHCPFLLDIREELGLPRDPLYPLHLTVGNSVNL